MKDLQSAIRRQAVNSLPELRCPKAGCACVWARGKRVIMGAWRTASKRWLPHVGVVALVFHKETSFDILLHFDLPQVTYPRLIQSFGA